MGTYMIYTKVSMHRGMDVCADTYTDDYRRQDDVADVLAIAVPVYNPGPANSSEPRLHKGALNHWLQGRV